MCDLLQGSGQIAAHQEGQPDPDSEENENVAEYSCLQLRDVLISGMIGLRYSPNALQDRKQRNDIAGQEQGDEPGSDAYAQGPWCRRQAAVGEKVLDHPALEGKLEYKESGGYGDQPGIEAAKKGAYDDLPIGTVKPKKPRINNRGGHPNAKGNADEKKRLVEQSLARFEYDVL
jgi:hypothetical protein